MPVVSNRVSKIELSQSRVAYARLDADGFQEHPWFAVR
jgi:hypothetical protein